MWDCVSIYTGGKKYSDAEIDVTALGLSRVRVIYTILTKGGIKHEK